MVAGAGRVKFQLLRGKPGVAARKWLLPAWVAALALFILDAILVASGVTRGLDVLLEKAVQGAPWGPLYGLMRATNFLGGARGIPFGIAVVVALAFFEKRAALLMALGAVGSLLATFVKAGLHRHRPTVDLVQVLETARGYSFPSGHSVYFTWMYFMLAVALAPKVPRRFRPALWATALFLAFMACVARVWVGAHWPSDVLGGFLLGFGWCCFVLWFPERFLPPAEVVPG